MYAHTYVYSYIHVYAQGGTTVDPTLPASTAISAATEAELQYIAERLIKAYRDSGFSHLVKTFRSLEMQNRGGLHGGQDDLTVCYRDVPSMFFRPDFSLRNPEMFNQVLGPSSKKDKDKDSSTGRLKALHQSKDGGTAPNKQEILSRYLDLVEVALLKQIWLKSTAFFRALDDIKGLQTSVASASGKISSLRSSLSSADEGIAMSAMKIPQLYRYSLMCIYIFMFIFIHTLMLILILILILTLMLILIPYIHINIHTYDVITDVARMSNRCVCC